MADEQSWIYEYDQVVTQSLGQDDVVHAHAERGTFNIKGG
jgi:hypothetical protein